MKGYGAEWADYGTRGLLEETFARGWGKHDWIDHNPDYDSLRDDPRFQAMLENLK